jgi:hypothetical protein
LLTKARIGPFKLLPLIPLHITRRSPGMPPVGQFVNQRNFLVAPASL